MNETRAYQLRIDKGLSRNAACKQLGMNSRTLRMIEHGVPVAASSLKRVGDFYGVPASTLMLDASTCRDEDAA